MDGVVEVVEEVVFGTAVTLDEVIGAVVVGLTGDVLTPLPVPLVTKEGVVEGLEDGITVALLVLNTGG